MAAQGDDVAVGLCGGKLGVDGFVARLGLCHEVRQGEVGVRSGHEVGVVAREQLVLDALGHAAQHADDEVAAAAAQGLERLEAVDDFLLGVVADGARIQENSVGALELRPRLVAGHAHNGGDDFTIGHVHLAAVSFDVQFLHEDLRRKTLSRGKGTEKTAHPQTHGARLPVCCDREAGAGVGPGFYGPYPSFYGAKARNFWNRARVS